VSGGAYLAMESIQMRRPIAVLRLLPLVMSGLALALAAIAGPVRAADAAVIVLPTTGDVDGAMAQYLADGITRAENEGSPAVVVQLNTPGGRLDATAKITGELLESPVPVIVWVSPAGGRAASAGTFITLASNLSYMAPGTNIGAASPIASDGGDIGGTLGVKVKNDAIANISAIAHARGRPVAWAASTVSDAKSYSAQEAVAAGAVDGIAATLPDVLAAANGKTVTVAGGRSVTLALAGVSSEIVEMSPFQAFIRLLANPSLAFVLFVIGILLLVFELGNPNIVSGIAGAVALVLAFIGFADLPVNVAGLVLIGFGIVLLLLETQFTSHGLLAIVAAAFVAVGAGTLYGNFGAPTVPGVEVALPVIVTMTGLTAAFGALIAVTAYRTRRMRSSPVLVGSLRVAGEAGVVSTEINPLGTVHAVGEEWTARSEDGRPLARGALVEIVRQDGLTLYVSPAESGSAT
jgi:membrane-bound serine protease (ClpP class)